MKDWQEAAPGLGRCASFLYTFHQQPASIFTIPPPPSMSPSEPSPMTPLLFWGLSRLFSPAKECHLPLGSPGKDGSIFSIFSIKLDWLLKLSELAASLVLASGRVRPLEGPERLWWCRKPACSCPQLSQLITWPKDQLAKVKARVQAQG